jgi:hypothetical protein
MLINRSLNQLMITKIVKIVLHFNAFKIYEILLNPLKLYRNKLLRSFLRVSIFNVALRNDT